MPDELIRVWHDCSLFFREHEQLAPERTMRVGHGGYAARMHSVSVTPGVNTSYGIMCS